MVHPSYSEHANNVERHAHGKRCPAKTCPQHKDATDMDSPERGLFDEVYRVKRVTAGVHAYTFPKGSIRSGSVEGGTIDRGLILKETGE